MDILLSPMNEHKRSGIFVVADGIDGCGKGTIITALMEHLVVTNGLRALDLREHWNTYKTYPTGEEIDAAQLIISCEPTNVWVGRAIRDELVRVGAGYSAYDAALAFSLDRQILYRRVIIPALAAGKIILQERSVSTSLVYQTLQDHPIDRETMIQLPGNALALSHAPDLLLIPLLNTETALGRLAGRMEKNDHAVFEKRAFLEKADVEYRKPWLKEFFEGKGSMVLYMDGAGTREAVAAAACAIVDTALAGQSDMQCFIRGTAVYGKGT